MVCGDIAYLYATPARLKDISLNYYANAFIPHAYSELSTPLDNIATLYVRKSPPFHCASTLVCHVQPFRFAHPAKRAYQVGCERRADHNATRATPAIEHHAIYR